MDKKLLVIDVAALGRPIEWDGPEFHLARTVFPAVTCTVQASFRTAAPPRDHGMIANGRYFRDLNKPMFWEQSARLVDGPRIWDGFRAQGGRVAMLFWQQSLGEDVDIVLSPAPIHKHHGGMIMDCYCQPAGLYGKLCDRLGAFKLRHYWGPLAKAAAGDWIADATCAVLEDPELAPDLCFTYLPTLDYDLQRKDLCNATLDTPPWPALRCQLQKLHDTARNRGYDVLVFGDYHIAPVKRAVCPNQALLEAGLMQVRNVRGMLYPDFNTSRAFAMVDHEAAHVYVRNPSDIEAVRTTLASLPGVARVLDASAQRELAVDHRNSGELVLIADDETWFAYSWWASPKQAPDYASHIDIHNKPGYDPCELFFGWPPPSVSQDPGRISGSHGKVGKGRDIAWASTIAFDNEIGDVVALAQATRNWLEQA